MNAKEIDKSTIAAILEIEALRASGNIDVADMLDAIVAERDSTAETLVRVGALADLKGEIAVRLSDELRIAHAEIDHLRQTLREIAALERHTRSGGMTLGDEKEYEDALLAAIEIAHSVEAH